MSQRIVLSMLLRISLVVVIASGLSYRHLEGVIERGVREQLWRYTQDRSLHETQWLELVDRRLTQLRDEYLQRYLRATGTDPEVAFGRYFVPNGDGTLYTRAPFYKGTPGSWGNRIEGISGGVDKGPMTKDRKLRLVLGMEMLVQHGPGFAQPYRDSGRPLTPAVDFYVETPEKDLLVYWPGIPWYPDYKGGFDLATQGEFARMYDRRIPFRERERCWSGAYRDDVAKVWMVSLTMPIEHQGRSVAGVGVDITLQDLNRRLVDYRFPGARSLIVRRDGRLIADPLLEEELIARRGEFFLERDGEASMAELMRLIRKHPAGGILEDGRFDRLVCIGPLPGPDWLLVTLYPKRQMNSLAVRTAGFVFGLGLLSLLVEVAMMWYVLRRDVTRPLAGFVRSTREVSEGRLEAGLAGLPAPGEDELGVLEAGFRQMIGSVQESRARLDESLASLERTVEERTRDLEHSTRRAEEASRAKTMFLSSMSHELRTPLNAILGFTRILSEEPGATPSQKEHLGIVTAAGDHLLSIIDGILDLAKIEAGQMTADFHTFDLDALMKELIGLLRVRAESKGIGLVLDPTSSFPRRVRSDPAKLRQILINLVGNAIKFTTSGQVSVRLTSTGSAEGDGRGLLEFAVTDTGCGISAEDRERIFEPFEQVSPREGTGLGLALTRQFVALLEGRLSVEAAPEQGSVFRFSVVFWPVAAEDSPGMAWESGTSPRIAGAQGMRVLVVDDHPDNRRLAREMLAPLGFDVREASGGSEGLEVVRLWQPRLVLMDRRMPGMDGIETVRRIRELPGALPVIVGVTAHAYSEERQEMLEAGCDGFLAKPYSQRQLQACLVALLGAEEPEAFDVEGMEPRAADWEGLDRTALHAALLRADMQEIEARIVPMREGKLKSRLLRHAGRFEYAAMLGILDHEGKVERDG